MNQRLGAHGAAFHDARVQGIEVKALEADERHGYAGRKGEAAWEAALIKPVSKFILSHVQGKRNEELLRRLLIDGAAGRRSRLVGAAACSHTSWNNEKDAGKHRAYDYQGGSSARILSARFQAQHVARHILPPKAHWQIVHVAMAADQVVVVAAEHIARRAGRDHEAAVGGIAQVDDVAIAG
jgi:hypothetical protein